MAVDLSGSPLISCSSSFLAVALLMTSSRTVEPWDAPFSPATSPPCATSSASVASFVLVCWRIEMRVSSGMPGMSLSAMALSSATIRLAYLDIARLARRETYSTSRSHCDQQGHIVDRP